MKNNSTTSVAIVSSDARLQSILSSDASNQNTNLSFHLENDLVSLISSPVYDAYIYDVDMANSDITSIISTISDLSSNIGKKTLILIGRKETLRVLANAQKLEGVISKTISKPVSFGQIKLAIETYSNKPKFSSATTKFSPKSTSNNLPKLVACAVALAIVIIGAYSISPTQHTKKINSAPLAKDNDIPATVDTKDEVTNDIEKDEITQLKEQAMAAMDDGRLSAPKTDNAIYYLQQLVNLDPYNRFTNQVHSKLYQRLVSIYEDQRLTGSDKELRNTINLILEIEPYNHEYGVRLRELNERIYLAKISQQNEVVKQKSGAKANESSIERN